MNTYFIRVVVDPSGAVRGINRIAQALDDIDNKASHAGSMLRTLFAVDIARRAVMGVVRLGDAYTDLEAKVRNASGKNDLLTVSMDKVFRAANRARTDVGAFGKTVLAISGATANMNLGFDASVRMTETLAKMMKIGGATTQEAKSATIQYGQALRKGILNGDEMRSVMENSIELQKALAKSMGISTDELLKQSKAGKITRAVMVDALIKTADEVDRKFAQMSMKVSDAWTVIENSAVRFAGSLKISETLAPILLFIADNFDTIGKAALVAANVIGTYFVRKGIALAIAGLVKLGAFMLANPFTAIIYGITAAAAALRIFGRDMQVATGFAATWGDVFDEAWDQIKSGLDRLINGLKEGLSVLTGFFGEIVDAADITFKDILMFFGMMVDSIIKIAEYLKDTVVTIFGGMGATIASGFIQAVNKIIDIMNDMDIRLQKLKDFATGDFKGKYATRSSGNVIPPPADAPFALTWTDPSKIPGRGPEQTVAGGDRWMMSREPKGGLNVPNSAMVQVNRTAADEAAARGFTHDTFLMAQKLGITLNEAAKRIEAGGVGQPEYEGSFKRIENPFDGAYSAMAKKTQEDWDKLWDGENKGPVQKLLEGVFKGAEARHGKKPGDTRTGLGEFGGKVGDPPVDEKAKKARESALKDWEQLQASINGVYKAELELANAQETIDKARAHGIKISGEQEEYVMNRKRTMLEEQLDPYAAVMREIDKQIAGTRLLGDGIRAASDEYAIHNKAIEERNKLWEKGAFITQEQTMLLERQMLTAKGLADDQNRKDAMLKEAGYVSAEEQKARALARAKRYSWDDSDFAQRASVIENSTFTPRMESAADRYAQDLQRITDLGVVWLKQGMSQNQVLAMQQVLLNNLNSEYGLLVTNQQSVTAGLRDGWNQAFMEFGKTSEQVSNFIVDSFNRISDAIVELVTTGKINWDSLVMGILEGMARIATQRLIWELMNLVGGSIAGPGAPTAINAVAQASGLGQHATGGIFKVSGPPGRDNVLIPPMWLSDGEHLAIWPQGQQPEGQESQPAPVAGGGTNVIVVRNEREAALAVMQSPAGRRTQVKNLTYSEAYLRTIQAKS